MDGPVLLRVTGADRVSFLHRMLTCEVEGIPVGGSVRGLFLTRKGRVVADFTLRVLEDAVHLLAPPAARPGLRDGLSKYVVADDVRIEEVEPPAGADLSPDLEAARIEAGVPLLGAEATEETLPQECGMDHLVSYTKGCFLGQEAVGRLHAQGHANRRLAGILLDPGAAVPARGTPVLREGKEVGAVTSAAFSPRLGRPVALAILRNEAAAAGTRLSLGIASDLPFA